MSTVKATITISLDGYVAGPSQSTESPLGVGGEALHEWLVPLKAFREQHREGGGEGKPSTQIAEQILGGVGATIMGRNMFRGGPGPRGEGTWERGWGGEP